jgi:dTDP-4-amino-4,6-dideoxygalactose transaminase
LYFSGSSHPKKKMDFRIGFNKPYLSGNEIRNIAEAASLSQLSGDGIFTARSLLKLQEISKFRNLFLMPSCTAALEVAALLLDIKPGDEVIVPSYTFVSTANAFALRGAKIIFADSGKDHPNVDPEAIASLITKRTKAIVPVHYAGAVADMDTISSLAKEAGAFIVEDAAQALGSLYKGNPAGSFGDISAFSFHETKNITCGEGGLLVVHDDQLAERAAVIRDKGTNRKDFRSGKTDRYTWVDIGSSYTAGELSAAFLFGQLENFETIQSRRISIWKRYSEQLNAAGVGKKWQLAHTPEHSTNNAHMFWMVTGNKTERDSFIKWMEKEGIQVLFHYQPLHASPFGKRFAGNAVLPNAERFGNALVRLPLFFELSDEGIDRICDAIVRFFKS